MYYTLQTTQEFGADNKSLSVMVADTVWIKSLTNIQIKHDSCGSKYLTEVRSKTRKTNYQEAENKIQ